MWNEVELTTPSSVQDETSLGNCQRLMLNLLRSCELVVVPAEERSLIINNFFKKFTSLIGSFGTTQRETGKFKGTGLYLQGGN